MLRVFFFAGRKEPNNDHQRLAQTGIDQLSTKTKIQTLKYPDFYLANDIPRVGYRFSFLSSRKLIKFISCVFSYLFLKELERQMNGR